MLNREPMGMKHPLSGRVSQPVHVSVLNREPMGMKPSHATGGSDALTAVSVLNREPMGMKHN